MKVLFYKWKSNFFSVFIISSNNFYMKKKKIFGEYLSITILHFFQVVGLSGWRFTGDPSSNEEDEKKMWW